MSLTPPCRVFAIVLYSSLMSLGGAVTTAAQDLAIGVAVGPSAYDLSGTGTGAAGAVLLAWAPVRGLVVEPGVTVFTYRSQFDERTILLFPELSIQGELPLGRIRPFLGGGAGGGFVATGAGETVATLHAVGGVRIAVGNGWGARGEMRVRAVRPWTGNSAFLLLNRWDRTEWQRLPVWYSTPPADAELTGFTDGDRDSWARASIVPDLEQVLTVPGRYRFELLWYTSPAPVSLFPEVERTSNPFEIAS